MPKRLSRYLPKCAEQDGDKVIFASMENFSSNEAFSELRDVKIYAGVMSDTVTIFTIGFTGSSAEHFFGRLKQAGVKKVIDTRLWASSQLAGFARKKDLPYFVKELAGASYEYREDLAPTKDILKNYKEGRISWDNYEVQYIDLITHRNLAKVLSPDEVNEACFLCACKTEHNCHRRLLAEYLQREWDQPIEIMHL